MGEGVDVGSNFRTYGGQKLVAEKLGNEKGGRDQIPLSKRS